MVTALAFVATAVASLFAESVLVRYTQRRTPHLLAWTVALALFALASATLSVGVSTGWDAAAFRIFYLLGAVLNVPWLALGTVYLLYGPEIGRRAHWALVFFSGLATGVMLSTDVHPLRGTEIPVGSDVLEAFPRALAGIGSGVGAIVIIAGAVYSAARYARDRQAPNRGRLAASNALIALGTLVLSSGGLVQGFLGHDEAFTLSLALGIGVIYAGFLVAESRREARVPGGASAQLST
jgi:hypothetical protein